jgi:hypothetical protein
VQSSIRGFGFKDRADYNVGFLQTGVRYGSADNNLTGGKVYFCRFDYPVARGDHLTYLLEAIAPQKYGKYVKVQTFGDWILPDVARVEGCPPDTVTLHERHQRLPAYREFDENNRSSWMERMTGSTLLEGVFGFLVSTDFIEPETYASAQFALWSKEQEEWRSNHQPEESRLSPAASLFHPVNRRFWQSLRDFFIGEFDGKQSITQEQKKLLVALHRDANGYPYDYKDLHSDSSLFDLVVGSIAMAPVDLQVNILLQSYSTKLDRLIDPASGKTWVSTNRDGSMPSLPRDVEVSLSGGSVIITDTDIAAQISLDGVHTNGTYMQSEGDFSFSEQYRKKALYPLLVWEEGKNGQRTFLDQTTAARFLPDHLVHPGLDVFLGRVTLAHLAGGIFPQAMYLPKPSESNAAVDLKEGKGQTPADASNSDYERIRGPRRSQKMAAAQTPVVVSLPNYASRLLASDSITALQQHIDSLR